MKTSESTDKIIPALAQAGRGLKNAYTSGRNPHFKSKFVPLPDAIDHIAAVYSQHGLHMTTPLVSTSEGGIGCVVRVVHESGQWIENEKFTVQMSEKNAGDPQKVLALCTYVRRGAILASAGIAGDEDADGENLVERSAPAVTLEKPTADQVAEFNAFEQRINAAETERGLNQIAADIKAAAESGAITTGARDHLREWWKIRHEKLMENVK